MKLPQICIRQPVLAIVLSLVLVVLGVVGYQTLEIRFFPKLKLPVVKVNTYYQGASAKLMESQVTTPIENTLAGIDGVESITSSSYTERSYITVTFRLGGDFEQEASEVRDRVFGIRNQLPTDTQMPTITVGATGNTVLGISFTDKYKSTSDIRNYVERVVYPQLRQLEGVGSVGIMGASDYAMRVWLNAQKMAAQNVTATDIKNAITQNNIYFPAGAIRGPMRSYGIVSKTQLQSPEAFGNIIVRHDKNGTIRLKDVAQIELGNTSLYQAPLRVNGQNGLEITVQPLQEANPIQVAHRVKAAMEEIQQDLPPGMKASVNYDASIFLSRSIDETVWAIGEAVILVIFVVFLFLGSMRAASIPIVTIPVSLISVFFIMKLLGFTINTMSLLGLVLAIGLVVDDAIVMLENIHRHIEEGMQPLEAALTGSKEIAFAVVSMALTLIAVYAPIGFVQGFTSELFKEFAFTLAGAVVISAFVALTLSPMMCSRLLLPRTQDTRYIKLLDRSFEFLSDKYEHFLNFALLKRRYVALALVAIAGLGYLIFINMPSQLVPKEDIGMVQVSISAPSGSSLESTETEVLQVEKIAKSDPAVSGVITQIYSSGGNLFVTLKPWNERAQTTQQVVKYLNDQFDEKIVGVNAAAFTPNIVNYGEQGHDIDIQFTTTKRYKTLLPSVDKMEKLLKNYPGVMNVSTNLRFDNQQYAITIHRDLAAVLGVNIQDIADTVQTMLSGNHWTDIQDGNRSYDVLVQMQKQDMANFDALNKLYVRSASNKMIPVSSLVTLKPIVGQSSLVHYNRFRAGTVYARLAPGYTESQAVNFVKSHINDVLVPNVHYAFSGKAEQFLNSSSSIVGIMIMSLIFIYLVLSAQFGSFIDPLIVLLAVPLCIVGALFSLWITGGTISIYSQIGFVTLIGLISKHGILITQFINDLRKKGEAFQKAIIEGAKIRLRPVLMTTSAMVFGTLPLAFAAGPGSIGRHEIGWVIVGGLLFGTFFSLVVVPIAYSYFGKLKK